MAFVAAMNSTPTKAGVKGSDVYTEAGVGDSRVVLFQQLVRGLDRKEIRRILYKAPEEHLVDYLVMAFQTRDVRGGKGEKALFYEMLDVLFVRRPDWIVPVVELIPTYGYWKDLWVMYERMWIADETNGKAVRLAINALVKRQFEADLAAEAPSLLAKWLPREKSANRKLARRFAGFLFGHMEGANDRAEQSSDRSAQPAKPAADDDKLAAYRKAVAALNKKLATVEIAMCGAAWREIKPGTVPGRCLLKNRKAFLLQHKRAKLVAHLEDRIACRDRFVAHITGGGAVKGAGVVYPHEIVARLLGGADPDEQALLEGQWASIRTAAAGGFRRIVPLCDFSGSMNGTPLLVSLALGILISEIASPAFKDHILGFDSNPSWISFKDCGSLKEKIDWGLQHAQGTSTDFQAACDLVLKRLVECAVPADEAPEDLLVFTDMGFDQACDAGLRSGFTGNSYGHVVKSAVWQTHCQMIRTAFEAAGYRAPRIIIWNLRAAYKDFHAKAEEEGVLLLSGWSPAVLKIIQSGGVKIQTPYEAVRAVLDDERYDAVRAVGSGAAIAVGGSAAIGGAGAGSDTA